MRLLTTKKSKQRFTLLILATAGFVFVGLLILGIAEAIVYFGNTHNF